MNELENNDQESISYLEYRILMNKIDRLSKRHAQIQRKKEETERNRRKLKMMEYIKNEYENLNENELVYCFKRMAKC